MRREPLFGIALLLSGVGELAWASTFYGDESYAQAAVLFLAACGLFLAAAGVFFAQGAWTWQWGLATAAAGHVTYLGLTITWGAVLVMAAALAAIGLALAAWGSMKRPDLVRYGLFAAALGGAVWTVNDAIASDMDFMVGNVFTMFGWGAAAALVPEKLS